MSKLYAQLQNDLKAIGLYTGVVDGLWGGLSHAAFLNARRQSISSSAGISPLLLSYCKAVAWSSKVTPSFVKKTSVMAKNLGLPWDGTDTMMACMAFETGGTFSPTIQNGAGAPYYGLIQFGKDAATDAGTTIDALLKMTALQQLDYVYNFFKPYTGKLHTLSDIYMRILYPKAVGKPESFALFSKANTKSKAYMQNKGLDADRDGLITKAEAAAKVQQKYVEGLNPVNLKVA